ncbi:hypothetical protein J3F84DRAFT_357693 [Trichoderma pleuroticola]
MHLHPGTRYATAPSDSSKQRARPSGDTGLPVSRYERYTIQYGAYLQNAPNPRPPTLCSTHYNLLCLILLRSRPHTGDNPSHPITRVLDPGPGRGPLTPPCFPNPRASMAALSIWWCRSWRPFGSLVLPETTGHLCLCASACTRYRGPTGACCRTVGGLLAAGSHRTRCRDERRDETTSRCLPSPVSDIACLLPVQSLEVWMMLREPWMFIIVPALLYRIADGSHSDYQIVSLPLSVDAA